MGYPATGKSAAFVLLITELLVSLLHYSPLKSTIRVVLGQQIFNKTTDVTQTFEIEKYILHPQYSVFNPTEHDIGEYFSSDSSIFHLLDLVSSLDALLETAFRVEKS